MHKFYRVTADIQQALLLQYRLTPNQIAFEVPTPKGHLWRVLPEKVPAFLAATREFSPVEVVL